VKWKGVFGDVWCNYSYGFLIVWGNEGKSKCFSGDVCWFGTGWGNEG
jgi:hypothetical protein